MTIAGARALRFEREPPARVEAIVIVGSTCVGKTTLVDAVRRAARPGVDVPLRWVTRPARADDLAAETRSARPAELDAAIAGGAIALHWSRTFGGGRVERYAFAVPAPGALPVYSANNAIYVAGNVQPADALVHALLVGVYAPDDLRERRLRARSPALCRDDPDEVRARLAEAASTMLPHVHAVIDNHGELEAVAPHDLVALVDAVARRRDRV